MKHILEQAAEVVQKKHKKKDPIHIKHPGALHSELDVKQGEPIPAKKLAAAKNSKDPLERKQATFAENEKKWNHK